VDEVITSLQGKDDAESHNLKARAYYAEDKTDEAIREAEKAVEMQPNNALYHLWLGRAYGQKAEKVNVFRQAGLAGKVRDQFQKAVELDGNNTDARSDLAEYYVDAPGMMGGGVDKAKAQADAVAQKDAALAHFIRAKIAEKAKDWYGAVKEYKAAIESSKTPAEQWLNLASHYKDRKNTAGMVDAIKKAAATPHKSAAVWNDAAGMLLESGQDFNLAIELAKKYLASNEKSEEAPAFKTHVLLGRLLEKQGDKAGAEKEYQSARGMAREYKVQ
jgi:Tfp pilus assembly protein PilF